jgi:uncharacterized protein (TIGR03067 family)
MTRIGRTAAALCAAAALCSAGRGDDPPKPVLLSQDDVNKMLTKMGHEFPASKGPVTLTIDRGTWRSVIRVSTSNDKTRIWLDAGLVTVTRLEDVPTATWRNLLVANEQVVTPAAFSLDPKSRRLYLNLALANENVTPAQLQAEINKLDGLIEKTKDLWKVDNFAPAVSAEGQKELERLAGTWRVTEFDDLGKSLPADEAAQFKLVVEKNQFRLLKGDTLIRRGVLVPGVEDGKPYLDRYHTTGGDRGVYKLDGDTLTWAYSSADRPEKFAGNATTTVLTLKREK